MVKLCAFLVPASQVPLCPLQGISLPDAKQLAETEASRKYNCDRLIDPRFDFLKKGKRILRITVDGRPGNYRTR